ncbi:MAG: hypothetical protein M3401_15395 [Actinomycetota bacterium]|nr:hypothetical protein [Actinomycetota bacterium]
MTAAVDVALITSGGPLNLSGFEVRAEPDAVVWPRLSSAAYAISLLAYDDNPEQERT